MPKIFHIKEINFEIRESRIPDFRWHTSPRLATQVNSEHLQFDIRSLDSGKFSFPYHSHRASEELFYVISGEATLRTPDGFQKVMTGDIVFFEEGPTSAHQLYNHSDSPCIYLDIRSFFGIDVTDYPDSGKINVSPFMEIFENTSKTDYYKGEEEVSKKWPAEILKKTEDS
jgi:uncharacterized cupin superfamily protein